MARCNFCGATFGSRQGVRAHLKGCAAYQAREAVNQPESNRPQSTASIGNLPIRQSSEPKAMTPRGRGQQITMSDHGSRLREDEVDTVLCLHEELRALRRDLVEALLIRRLLASAPKREEAPEYQDWYELARDVLHLEQATDRIVTQARVTRDEPWSLHKLALSGRERWVSWRREEAFHLWQKIDEGTEQELDEIMVEFGVPELEASWTRVIERFRWLTSHTKATL